jgi:hypothetical protein
MRDREQCRYGVSGLRRKCCACQKAALRPLRCRRRRGRPGRLGRVTCSGRTGSRTWPPWAPRGASAPKTRAAPLAAPQSPAPASRLLAAPGSAAGERGREGARGRFSSHALAGSDKTSSEAGGCLEESEEHNWVAEAVLRMREFGTSAGSCKRAGIQGKEHAVHSFA